ncbi:STAS domain-containing protein [Aeromicrobium sp.]|uniref:STAS domain-containing protein n=1 Tax=Aeromicrobium sp. TaxID=1871063 RepID=UPI003C62BA51
MAQFSEEVRGDGVCVVRADGELDLATVEEFIGVVRGSLSRGSAVEIDLGDITFMDSSGLGALVRLRKEADGQDASLSLTRVTASTDRLLQLTGLLDYFDIRATRD